MFNFIKSKYENLFLRREDLSKMKANLTGQAGKGKPSVFQTGFTLVELLITITMFVIITGVVLVNSNTFDNSILLHNFAYDVALTIKQAQSYAVNVQESNATNVGDLLYKYPYGVYFDISHNTNYVFFTDVLGPDGNLGSDSIYDADVTSCATDNPECIQKYTMTRGAYIKSICAGSDETDCDNSSAQKLSILFIRPNLGAKIYINDKIGTDKEKNYAKIVLGAADGATSTIIVNSAGQIYVRK